MTRNFITNQRLAELAGLNYDAEAVQPGPIVYSRTQKIHSQFRQLGAFPPCVLITSYSDACVTDGMLRVLPPNVRRWYSNNVRTRSPLVRAVPIGIRTSVEGEALLRAAMDQGRPDQKGLLYLCFSKKIPGGPTPNPRRGLYEKFEDLEWVTAEGGGEPVPMEQFYEGIASHPYVLSPPGAGPDCHRHWESILLGSIPVVLRSPEVEAVLEGFPCLMVRRWDEVTEERLLEELPGLQERFALPMESLWFEYWESLILEDAGCLDS